MFWIMFVVERLSLAPVKCADGTGLDLEAVAAHARLVRLDEVSALGRRLLGGELDEAVVAF